MQLINKTWQPVPGAEQVLIFPFFRKPSITSSNSYVLKFPSSMVVIDPGADPVQASEIAGLFKTFHLHERIHAYIWLTHVHFDHFMCLDIFSDLPFEIVLACHEHGAGVLENRDHRASAAELFGQQMPEMKYKIISDLGRHCSDFRLELNDPDSLEILHTPGHTPDSICIRLGSLFFAGDLPYACESGVAGVAGWSKDNLVTSLRRVNEYIEQKDKMLIMPGHGFHHEADATAAMLGKVLNKAINMPDIASLDVKRTKYLFDFACSLLEEAEVTLGTISARLLKTSHYLEVLEENDAARGLLELVDMDQLDELLYDFSVFIRKFAGNPEHRVTAVLKGAQFVARVNRIFCPDKVTSYIDAPLLRRWNRLLDDYLTAVRGVSFSPQGEKADLNIQLEKFVDSLNKDVNPEEALLESASDQRLFVEEITRRIALSTTLPKMEIEFKPYPRPAIVCLDMTSMEDLLVCALEQLSLAGITKVMLGLVQTVEGELAVVIRSISGNKIPDPQSAKLKYLAMASETLGCRFFHNSEVNEYCWVIDP